MSSTRMGGASATAIESRRYEVGYGAPRVGQLILALAQVDDMPEQTVRGPLDVTDLDDHFGAHPMDPAKCRAA